MFVFRKLASRDAKASYRGFPSKLWKMSGARALTKLPAIPKARAGRHLFIDVALRFAKPA
jgi:hypothetical protein